MGPNALAIVIGIVALPFQLIQAIVWNVMSFVTFDVLGLGPYLPITLGS